MAMPLNDDTAVVDADAAPHTCGGELGGELGGGGKADEEALEREAFVKIVRAMQGYASDAAEEVHRWERNFEKLSEAHRTLLSHHRDKHVEAYRCVRRNDEFFRNMLESFTGDDVPPHLQVPPPPPGPPAPVSPGDVDKVRYVLKNLARDWSEEAAGERAQCHGPILAELEARLTVPGPNEGKYPPRVMVPGRHSTARTSPRHTTRSSILSAA